MYLAPQDLKELKLYSNQDRWVLVLQLVKAIEQEALVSLSSFRDSNDAFERRGEVTGIRRVLKQLTSIRDLETPNIAVDMSNFISTIEDDNERHEARFGAEY